MNEIKTLIDEAGTFLTEPWDDIIELLNRGEYIRQLNERFGVRKLNDLPASDIEEYRAALRQYGKV